MESSHMELQLWRDGGREKETEHEISTQNMQNLIYMIVYM